MKKEMIKMNWEIVNEKKKKNRSQKTMKVLE